MMPAPPELRVYTFRRGLLARFGHDLQLHVSRFELELDGPALRGRFATDSLRVDGAITRGALDRRALSDSDRAQIERAVADEVLLAALHPEVTLTAQLRADGARFALSGQVALHGQAAPVSCRIEPRGERWVAELDLVPSRLGIAPYRALGGTLTLEDRVRIVASVPTVPLAADPASWRAHWSRSD